MKNKEIKKLHFIKHQIGNYRMNQGYYATYIGKPLAFPLLKILIHLPISGTHVTFFMILLGLIGASFIGFPNLALIGCIILQFTIILDCVDGSLARYRKQKSVYGRYLDAIFHNLTNPLLFFMLGVYSYNYFNNIVYIFLGFITAFLMFGTNIIFLNKYYMLIRETNKPTSTLKRDMLLVIKFRKSNIQKIVGGIVLSLNRFPNIFTLFLIAKIFNFLQYLIFIYLPFYLLIAIVKIASDFKSAKKELG